MGLSTFAFSRRETKASLIYSTRDSRHEQCCRAPGIQPEIDRSSRRDPLLDRRKLTEMPRSNWSGWVVFEVEPERAGRYRVERRTLLRSGIGCWKSRTLVGTAGDRDARDARDAVDGARLCGARRGRRRLGDGGHGPDSEGQEEHQSHYEPYDSGNDRVECHACRIPSRRSLQNAVAILASLPRSGKGE